MCQNFQKGFDLCEWIPDFALGCHFVVCACHIVYWECIFFCNVFAVWGVVVIVWC